jgi:hypothetical protein
LYFVLTDGHLQGALMMQAANTSETSVNFYQTTRRYNPEDSHFHTRSRENLKSCFVLTVRKNPSFTIICFYAIF